MENKLSELKEVLSGVQHRLNEEIRLGTSAGSKAAVKKAVAGERKKLRAQIMASAAETENLKEENRANRAIILGLGASVETMKADYENKLSKGQQQLKRLESKYKNVVASLEAENTDHRRTAQELRSKSNENESWREKVSTLNSRLDVLDDLKIKFAAEQKKVTDLRRQVSVLLIGLSPDCQY